MSEHAENLREIADTLRGYKCHAAAAHTERAAAEIERLTRALEDAEMMLTDADLRTSADRLENGLLCIRLAIRANGQLEE
jgi:hypothetical protein